MQIRHLLFFVTLAQEKHFGRAARACGVSQPTLSSAIQKLEKDLDVQLIERGQSFRGLTGDGVKVLAWGKRILDNYDLLRADLSVTCSIRKSRQRSSIQSGPLLPDHVNSPEL